MASEQKLRRYHSYSVQFRLFEGRVSTFALHAKTDLGLVFSETGINCWAVMEAARTGLGQVNYLNKIHP